MLVKFLWVILFFISSISFSQNTVHKFFDLSAPEKWWVVFHPFTAKKAMIISTEALRITDSIADTNQIGKDKNGGKLDAFKHSYWMFSLTINIGKKRALKLGVAHEKGNFRTFKKNQFEDGVLSDKPSSEMDLFNNNIGAQLGDNHSLTSKKQQINYTIQAIKLGKMRILKKDEMGNFLNCNGDKIAKENLVGQWENDKCLVDSQSE